MAPFVTFRSAAPVSVPERIEPRRARAVTAPLHREITILPNRARASIDVQLASVAGQQGRADDALRLLAAARALLPAPGPPALEAYAADALARVWRWREAEPFARTVTEKPCGPHHDSMPAGVVQRVQSSAAEAGKVRSRITAGLRCGVRAVWGVPDPSRPEATF